MWEKDQYHFFMKCLTCVHQWEINSNHLLDTIVGRHVYLCIISEINEHGEINSKKSLKQIFSHPNITDRAIRFKLRELENLGYIYMEVNNKDGRTRSIRVTQKFLDFMDHHNGILFNSYKNNFILLSTTSSRYSN